MADILQTASGIYIESGKNFWWEKIPPLVLLVGNFSGRWDFFLSHMVIFWWGIKNKNGIFYIKMQNNKLNILDFFFAN